MHMRGLTLVSKIAYSLALVLIALPAAAQQFPAENDGFIQINPTVPNSALNFNDSNESCCAKDYAMRSVQYQAAIAEMNALQKAQTVAAVSEFEANNPSYSDAQVPSFLVECEKYAQAPELASNGVLPGRRGQKPLPIDAYSMHVSNRTGAEYFTDPRQKNISRFHIEAGGGQSLVQLNEVKHYSVCMARGGNRAVVANSDNGSIISYNGPDEIILAGNNTNMLTRTGDGEDRIELHQANQKPDGTWVAHNIYKSALSGGNHSDTVEIKNTPPGTKWCHIGAYKIYGELFYVVEFALPPSVTEGPRRQRINIGKSVENVIFKGRKYTLAEFLNHGQPSDAVTATQPYEL